MRVNALRSLAAAAAVLPVLAVVAPPSAPAQAATSSISSESSGMAAPAGAPRGTVLDAKPLRRELWIPETTRKAFVLTYVTSNTFGQKATSTGTVFLPKGTPPRGGWPVISWAHGTSGLGDGCAPSRVGPSLPQRDWAYLSEWMKQGYAIVASDYAGLGTPGLHAYLDGRTTAHNVVDVVKAGRNLTRAHLPRSQQLSRKWVTIGQSQGGGASIYTARYATQYGGRQLDYRGAVGTGTPAYVEKLLLPLGPGVPAAPLSPGATAYLAYIFASLRYARPELGLDEILTDQGRHYLGLARTECIMEFEEKLDGVVIGDWFTKPLATLPGFEATTRAYMGMPESGFDRPFFMGHGIKDTDVPIAGTSAYVARLEANAEPVTFKTYPTDHSGTMAASQPDSIPFVRRLFQR